MVDPVRMGPVGAVAAASSRSNEVASAASNVVRLDTSSTSVASAPSLPRLLNLAADLAKSGPPVDYAKVAQVRRAIADGSYHIDAGALAKAILCYAEIE